MSFLHSHSSECLSAELDIFSIPPTQTSIEGSSFVYYKPIAPLSEDPNSPIEFVVPGAGEHYTDLSHVLLHLQCAITPNHSEVENAKVGPVNNFIHSNFSQVDVFFNNKLVTPSSNHYAYRSYLETLLNYNSEARNSHLTGGLWYDDEDYKMDKAANDATSKNSGLTKRQYFTLNGKVFDLIGHLHCDVFNQDRLLINGVEMRIRMVRSKDSFSLMDSSADGKFKVQIKDASLIVRRVKISPGVLLAHAQTLSRATAKYPVTRVEIKTFILNQGILSGTHDNCFLGQLPKRIIIGFVDNRAFNGDRSLNPFNFKHFNINYLSLYIDGVQVPSKPLQPNFTDANHETFIEALQTLYTATGIHFSNEGILINRQNYHHGYFLTAFDLTPDMSAGISNFWNVVRTGSIRIEVRFQQALTTTVNCVVYAEYDNLIEIDADRQIIADFTA